MRHNFYESKLYHGFYHIENTEYPNKYFVTFFSKKGNRVQWRGLIYLQDRDWEWLIPIPEKQAEMLKLLYF